MTRPPRDPLIVEARQLFGAVVIVGASPLDAAREYVSRGWSVIPTFADLQPDKPKAARVQWQLYQRRYPTDRELQRWFAGGSGGLAIVLGRVSRLAVADLDDPARFSILQRRAPHLLNTYTVQTPGRGGYHLYYTLPDSLLDLTTRKGAAGELRANGGYVVAPPTRINGKSYILTDDTQPRELTAADIAVLGDVLDIPNATPSSIGVSIRAAADDLLRQYADHRQTEGRNDALYHTALFARGAGWAHEDTLAALASTFVQDSPPPGHANETPEQRHDEAARTISSAYARAYNATTGETYHRPGAGLPNSAREALLQAGDIGTARVLDTLYLQGVLPGATISAPEAVRLCREAGISRKVVEKALPRFATLRLVAPDCAGAQPDARLILDNGNFVPDLHTNTDDEQPMVVSMQNGDKIQRGRKPRFYTMPDTTDVCRALGVHVTPGDALALDDCRSSKAYRLALHKALIRRRSGQELSRTWEAQRLGLSSRRTVYEYDRDPEIETSQHLERKAITWANVNTVPIDPLETVGKWLEIEVPGGTPKTVPPARYAAIQALRRSQRVTFVIQHANRYRLIETDTA